MELGTFGAILTFAMELEGQAAAFYERAAEHDPAGPYHTRARQARKRVVRLERARREGVSEMILEAIHGLSSEDYQVEPDPGAALEAQAALLEATAARFYRDAAAKIPIPEIERLFRRMARDLSAGEGR